MVNDSGVLNLDDLTDEEREQLERLATQHAADFATEDEGEKLAAHEAATAFLVVVNKDNTVFVSPDVNLDLTLDRVAGPSDIKFGAGEVVSHMEATQTAMLTQQIMMQAAQQMQQQMVAAQQEKSIREKLGL